SAMAVADDMGASWQRLKWLLQSQADPNDARLVRDACGIRYLPLATRNHQRRGARERVREVAAKHPDRLRVELGALVTRVVWDGDRAAGVEYLKGKSLYRAHVRPNGEAGERREAIAAREVILAGGAFNTPQLLMLSGVGPRETLASHG